MLRCGGLDFLKTMDVFNLIIVHQQCTVLEFDTPPISVLNFLYCPLETRNRIACSWVELDDFDVKRQVSRPHEVVQELTIRFLGLAFAA